MSSNLIRAPKGTLKVGLHQSGEYAVAQMPIYAFGDDVRPPGRDVATFKSKKGRVKLTVSEEDEAIFLRLGSTDGSTVHIFLDDLVSLLSAGAIELRGVAEFA